MDKPVNDSSNGLEPFLELEFQAVRAEHDMRVGKQQDVSNAAVALISIVVALIGAAAAFHLPVYRTGLLSLTLSISSMLLSALNLMNLDHDMNVAHIQAYIKERIYPALESSEGHYETWISYRARRQQGHGIGARISSVLASGKYAFGFASSTVFLASAIIATVESTGAAVVPAWTSWVLLSVSTLMWAATVAGLAYVALLYSKLALID